MKTTTTCLRMLQTSGLLLALSCCCAFGARGQADAPVTKVWDKTYGGSLDEEIRADGHDDELHAMTVTADGGFLLGGGVEVFRRTSLLGRARGRARQQTLG